jgi:tetratricopeptide (TPR) repeat protein/tRNA A-37 threonylcarbamoyl transferase component Bud32
MATDLTDQPLPEPDETVRRGMRVLARLGPGAAKGTSTVLVVENARLRLEKKIGQGANGEVWLAQDLSLNRHVAVKFLRPESQADEVRRTRLENEALALARLQNSPVADRVVKIYARGETGDGRRVLVLEYVEGGSLADRLRDDGNRPRPLAPREAAVVVEQVARTVAALHEIPLIHRDLKPGNVLLASGRGSTDGTDGTDKNHPLVTKLADFGLAHFTGGREPAAGARDVLGTPSYMAPEQASGEGEVGPGADIYAMGAILYECLAGRPPFVGENPLEILQTVREKDPVPLEELNRKVPRDLRTICMKCLQKKVEDRYARAADLAEDLRRFLANEPIKARPPGLVTRGWKLACRNPGWAAAFAACAAGFAVSMLFALVAWRQARAAEHEAARAARNAALRLAALDDVLDVVTGERLRRAGQTRLMRDMLERLTPRFEEVLELEDQDDATREQQGMAWNSLAAIRRATNQHDDALKASERAEELFRELSRRRAVSASAKLGLAIALSNAGFLLGQGGKFDDAIGKLQESAALLTALLAEMENAPLHYRLSLVQNNWANCLMRQRRGSEAEARYRAAIEQMDAAAKADPADLRYRDWQARALSNLALLCAPPVLVLPLASEGTVRALSNLALLCAQRQRAAEAQRHSAQAVAIARRLAADFAGEIDARECLAVCLTNDAELLNSAGKRTTSLALFREALELYRGLAQQVPLYLEYQWGWAMAESNVGAALGAGPPAEWDQAEKHLRRASDLYQELRKANPANKELEVYVNENRERLDRLRQKRAKR